MDPMLCLYYNDCFGACYLYFLQFFCPCGHAFLCCVAIVFRALPARKKRRIRTGGCGAGNIGKNRSLRFRHQVEHDVHIGAMHAVGVHDGHIERVLPLAVLFDIGNALFGFFLRHGDIHDQVALGRLAVINVHALDDRHILAGIGALDQRGARGLGQHEIAAGIDDVHVVKVHAVSRQTHDHMALLGDFRDEPGHVQEVDLPVLEIVFRLFKKGCVHFHQKRKKKKAIYIKEKPIKAASFMEPEYTYAMYGEI